MAKMCVLFVFALLVALQMGSISVEASSTFDDMYEEMELYDSSNQLALTLPETCLGKSFCFEKGDNYPDEKVEALLADMRISIVETSQEWPGVGDDKADDDCPSTTNNEPIYYITDEHDQVRVVVQLKDKFQQLYNVKTCTYEGPIDRETPHFMKNGSILKNFKMECVSTKMDLDFFVLSVEKDNETKKHKMEIARAKGGIPVCCKCRYDK